MHVRAFDNVFNDIREHYRKYAPNLNDAEAPSVEQIIDERSILTTKDGLFDDLAVKQYRWSDSYTADEYISLLNTNSRHRILPDGVRAQLFKNIKNAIVENGGTILKPQAVALFLARKRL